MRFDCTMGKKSVNPVVFFYKLEEKYPGELEWDWDRQKTNEHLDEWMVIIAQGYLTLLKGVWYEEMGFFKCEWSSPTYSWQTYDIEGKFQRALRPVNVKITSQIQKPSLIDYLSDS